MYNKKHNPIRSDRICFIPLFTFPPLNKKNFFSYEAKFFFLKEKKKTASVPTKIERKTRNSGTHTSLQKHVSHSYLISS